MSTAIQFKKAVKFEAKGRVGLIGPAGSGKSYTSLVLAKLLAGDKRIAAIDTEHGSLSKYADLFDFDVIEPDSYSADSWIESLTAAENAGYGVFLTDSLSHYWMGRDGALEFVDNASKRFKDQMGGWKEFSPLERTMIDRMIASPCHIICTMRTKTEYVEEVNAQGKKVRKKVGLAPVQRQGLEFEFDLVAYMDDENVLITDKTRCSYYTKKTISSPKEKDFKPFAEWLNGEHRDEPVRVPTDSRPVDIGEHKAGTKEAQAFVLNQKLAAIQQPADFEREVGEAGALRINEILTALVVEEISKEFGENGKELLEKEVDRYGVKHTRFLNLEQKRELALRLKRAVDANKVAKIMQPTASSLDDFLPAKHLRPKAGDSLLLPESDDLPPDALLVLWEEMTDIKSTITVFQRLKDELAAIVGDIDAEKIYRAALNRQGVTHSNLFKGDKAKGARPALREIFEHLQIAKRQSDGEEVTDEDIPN